MNASYKKIFIIAVLLLNLGIFNACGNEVQRFLMPFFPIRNVYIRKYWEFKDMKLPSHANYPESVLIRAPTYSMSNYKSIDGKDRIYFPKSIGMEITITNNTQDQYEIVIPEAFTCVVNNRDQEHLPFGDYYIISENGGRELDITDHKTFIIQGKSIQYISIEYLMPEAKDFLKIKYLSLFFENPSTKQKELVVKLKKYLRMDNY